MILQMNFPVSCRLLIIMAITMLSVSATAARSSHRNISLKSFIVAGDSNSTWRSPSGEFAFGFRQVSPGGYLLAIMFDEMPEKTIVWSANRGNLAERGSRVQFSADGRLELNNPRGQQIWAASLGGSGVAYGAMLDNGNFVLAGNNTTVVWQSFNYPTDTLLPEQVLNQGGILFASFSETNSSRGRFKFILQRDGNLVLYTLNYPMTDKVYAYWSTQSSVGAGYQLIFNQSGFIYLTAKNGTVLDPLSSNRFSTSQFYQRLTLDYDGVLRHYVYPKSAHSAGGMPMAWFVNVFMPSNICLRVGGTSGVGACGFNSLCSLGNDQRPICSCPKGYSPWDPTDRMGGCKPDFVQQRCDRNSNESDGFGFVDMASADWSNSEYYSYGSVTEEWCRQSCLGDCLCHAAVFRDSVCWKMGFPLRNGRIDSSKGGKSLVKIPLGKMQN